MLPNAPIVDPRGGCGLWSYDGELYGGVDEGRGPGVGGLVAVNQRADY